MKKIELTIILIVSLNLNLFAQNDDDTSKMIASVLGSAFFYGMLLLFRRINKKDKEK